jgi:hypothetical protein
VYEVLQKKTQLGKERVPKTERYQATFKGVMTSSFNLSLIGSSPRLVF